MNAIAEEIYVEIKTTLEQIERTNEILRAHRSAARPHQHSIANFLELRADYLAQLAELLAAFDVEIRLPMAVAA